MSDLVLARNCCLTTMLPGEAENGVGMNRSVREATALYKNYIFYNRYNDFFKHCNNVL